MTVRRFAVLPRLARVLTLVSTLVLVSVLPACASPAADANATANAAPGTAPAVGGTGTATAGTPYGQPGWQQLVELIRDQKWERGLPLARRFADEYPDNEWTRNNYGLCLLQTGRPRDARREFLAAEELNPHNIACVTNLAFVAARLGDIDDIIRYTRRRRALLHNGVDGPGASEHFTEILQLELAEALRRKGNRVDAIAAYEQGIHDFPSNWWFPEFLSLLYTVTNRERWLELKQRAEQLADRLPRESRIDYRLPVTGPARILQGHHGDISHRGAVDAYAWDFQPVRLEAVSPSDGGSEPGDGAPTGTVEPRLLHPDRDGTGNEHWVAWGAEVVAAADGTVLTMIDEYPDNPVNDTDSFTYGNGVVLLHPLPDGSAELSLYWHLQAGSVTVKPGAEVKAGDVLGRIGNSGVSLVPHLHFVVRRGPALGPGLDARFRDYVTRARGNPDAEPTEGVPAEGDVVVPQ